MDQFIKYANADLGEGKDTSINAIAHAKRTIHGVRYSITP
jgi:hypothetical protein